jgi:ABC-type oligopeptide transport system substrate-binding subunit
LPTAIHMEQSARARLNMFRKSWVADYPDAENYLALFYSKNFCPIGPNYTHFKNKVFDELYEKAKSVTNNQDRFELYHQMEKIILEEAPIIPLYYDQAVRFTTTDVSGLEINSMNLLTLKRVNKAA